MPVPYRFLWISCLHNNSINTTFFTKLFIWWLQSLGSGSNTTRLGVWEWSAWMPLELLTIQSLTKRVKLFKKNGIKYKFQIYGLFRLIKAWKKRLMLGTKAYSWLFGDTFTKNYISQKKVILKRRRKKCKELLSRLLYSYLHYGMAFIQDILFLFFTGL